MPHLVMRPRPAVGIAILVAAVMLVAGCRVASPPGAVAAKPVGANLPGPRPLSTSAPTSEPTATWTPLPTPTAVPTPLAATAGGSLPAGQAIFSTARDGEAGQELWRLPTGQRELTQVAAGIAAGGWDCAGARPVCAFVGSQGEVMALAPVTASLAVLDQLAPLPLAAGGITATQPITARTPLTASALTMSDDGAGLALATQVDVRLYDLGSRQPLASIPITGTTHLAWSPDSSLLSLVYRTAGGATLALWNPADSQLRVLARMNALDHVAWAPDGKKLAFDARTDAPTPSSQGGQSDVYVLNLETGEIRNLTEIFLRNAGVAANHQVAAWQPTWEADGKTLRYVRGIPGDPDTYQVFRHPLSSRSASVLAPGDAAGVPGLPEVTGGAQAARAVERAGFFFVQVNTGDGEWRDAAPAGFRGLHALAWAPRDPATAFSKDTPAGRDALLLAADQGLLLLDVTNGTVAQLVAACPNCSITRVEWLP